MRITRLPYETPREKARTSAILIGQALAVFVVLFLVVRFAYLAKLVFGDHQVTVLGSLMIIICATAEFAGMAMLFSGAWLGVQAVYQLRKAGERLELAWVTIVALPVTVLLGIFFVLSVFSQVP